jgi:2-hydroxychromene-2-carboxylate isomerase
MQPWQADRRIELWFDFASTYSYLSVMRIEGIARRHGLALDWRPFLLGPVFQAAGWNAPPFLALPAKGRYMWVDLARQCRKYGLPWQQPASFPKRSVLACRVGVLGQDSVWIGDYCRAVMQANFALDLDIDAPEVITGVLEQLGLPAAALLAEADSESNRARLRAQTSKASALGIFGAPSLLAAGELYWGDDRLEDAIARAVTSG